MTNDKKLEVEGAPDLIRLYYNTRNCGFRYRVAILLVPVGSCSVPALPQLWSFLVMNVNDFAPVKDASFTTLFR
jgi:hypothetical protein